MSGLLAGVLRSRGIANSLHDIHRAADRIDALQAALDLALALRAPDEPGDSRLVSDQYVAMAAIAVDLDADGKCLAFVRKELAGAVRDRGGECLCGAAPVNDAGRCASCESQIAAEASL